MSGRKATTNIIPGKTVLSVGKPDKPLPENWSWILLSDLAEMKTGHTPSRKVKEYWDEGHISWIAVGDARKDNGGFILETKEHTNQKGIDNSAAVLLPKHTVCLSRTASIGYCILTGKENMATSQGFVNWICSDYLNPRYLQMVFIAENQFLHEISEGTAHTTIYFPEAKAFNIAVPSKPHQDRIVLRVDALMAQHAAIQQAMECIPKLLKDFRQQVLTQAVTGKLTEEWRVGKDVVKATKTSLKNLGVWKGGGTPSKAKKEYWTNGDVSWITPKDMKSTFIEDSIDKITLEAVDNSSAILIPKNSILFVTRSGILRRIFPISSNKKETTVNQDIKALIVDSKYDTNYILFVLRGLEHDLRLQCMKSGTTVESVDFIKLKNYQIIIPDNLEQQEIVRRVESLFEKATAIEQRYEQLKSQIDNLPQSILHKAFKGELVEQLDSDGSAMELLREIEGLKKQN